MDGFVLSDDFIMLVDDGRDQRSKLKCGRRSQTLSSVDIVEANARRGGATSLAYFILPSETPFQESSATRCTPVNKPMHLQSDANDSRAQEEPRVDRLLQLASPGRDVHIRRPLCSA